MPSPSGPEPAMARGQPCAIIIVWRQARAVKVKRARAKASRIRVATGELALGSELIVS
jgi:hypothetical protein